MLHRARDRQRRVPQQEARMKAALLGLEREKLISRLSTPTLGARRLRQDRE